MAKASKKTREITVTLPEEEEVLETAADLEEAEQEEGEIKNILKDSQLGSGSYVWLLRKGPGEFNYAFIGEKIPVADFSIEEIASQFGGGDYKGKVYRQPDKGAAYIFRTLPPFKIDARKVGTRDKLRAGDPDKTDNTVMQMLSKILDGRGDKDGSAEALKKAATDSQQQMLLLMMTMMMESQKNTVQMFCALAGKPQQSSADQITPAIVELLKAAKRSPVGEIVETMKAIKELNADDRDDTPQDDSMIGLIKAFAGGIMPALQAPPGPQTSAPLPAQNQPGPGGSPPQFEGYIKRLVRAAAKNSNPESYYDLILDELSEEDFRGLQGALADQGFWTRIAQRPDVAQYAAWFEELRGLIVNGPQGDEETPNPKHQTPDNNQAQNTTAQ